jgi:DNA-directed RNA polymerase specialized sigma24 family protein
VRSPRDEAELVRAAAAGSPAAVDALWDAYGARVFAFCQRVLGHAGLAADAAHDAFLLAHAQLGRLDRAGARFGTELFRSARRTSGELLERGPLVAAPRDRGGLSSAAARLRSPQRGALALAGLEGLSHAEIAMVLELEAAAVPALIARARLRLYDELNGSAVAAAAVRSPDCEDVLPVLAAAADGELVGADATWADPHVTRCAACPRTIRAMAVAAATYAAWSPESPPSWLRAATLADVAAESPAIAPGAAPADDGGGRDDRERDPHDGRHRAGAMIPA